jgi:hypothetical protein
MTIKYVVLLDELLQTMHESSANQSNANPNWAKELALSFVRVRHLIGILKSQHQQEWDALVQLGKNLLFCTEELWTPAYHHADELFSTSCYNSCDTHHELIQRENRCLFRNLVLEFCMNN